MRPPVLGVCSWSLRPTDPRALAERAALVGVSAIQLALDPLRTGAWKLGRTLSELDRAGLEVRSGMMACEGEDYSTLASIRATGGLRPDATWRENLRAARKNARLARQLELPLVTLHAGFVPERAGDAERLRLVARLREIVDTFADEGVAVGLETGQETAATLLAVLAEVDRPGLGVNFDPANMVLYGMGDPVDALNRLAPHVRQVHVKDARPSTRPGEWGEEVPVGDGSVHWHSFFDALRRHRLDVDLMIEREAGEERVADAVAAARLVRAELDRTRATR